ncbi:aldo/keto reductase [Amnibacterium kyonggiense]|uniref:Aryl-alcohol dehydrogenase-like predicted oxidoreductase n=1 Tax=Amnibacterium kyonggiense TaxID=595671 RepID=A0A4R7FQI5_9MICO|nr:aldo/keto reductase [Amnibacterium kyonggiense]TDS79938.1 aryl-alcohol dehydrogenase-like predicted oxidoreductase [Amnibacterium kyonggiense]
MTTRVRLDGRDVPRIGFGAMQLRDVPEETAIAVLRRAVELGVRLVDTAAFYGAGVVNERIRAAIAPFADDLVIATKVGATSAPAPQELVLAQRPAELRAEVERNLRTLGVDRLDLVHLRRADLPPGLIAEGDQLVPVEDQLAELVALRDAGTIGAIGLSSASTSVLRAALPAGLASVQNAYNVLLRDTEDQLVLCREHGVVWMPYFPLGSAFDGMPSVVRAPAVVAAAAEVGATPGQVALAWLLEQSPEAAPVPGTRSVAHLEENVAAAAVRLTPEQLAALDAAAPAL